VARSGNAAHFFTDDDFVWVEPALETAPAMPTTIPAPLRPRPRPGQRRTLAGDVARLRTEVAAQTAALPPRARALLAACLLASLVVLALVVTFRGGGESAGDAAPPRSQTKGTAPKQAAAENAPTAPIRTLQAGDRAPAVADLQRALGALGLYSQPIDGVFGDSTGAAVLAFQQNQGLAADGVAGPTTVEALVTALSVGVQSDAGVVQDGLAAAESAGRLSAQSADRYSGMVADSLARLKSLRPGRVATLALAFHAVAASAADLDEPRALTLASMLKANTDYLAEHPSPTERVDIRDDDGVVYRFFPEHGFQFHPIADFARLNKIAAAGRHDEVRRLADALVARGVHSGKALLWEYYFPFGGPPHWASGFAQATAAQALARSGALLDDSRLFAAARAAYRAIPTALSLELGGGLWVREYGFSDIAILNAQLQSLVSLNDYVKITHDARAADLARRLDTASKSLLGQFDTGCWSRYSLGGSPASLHYHTYHVSLLKQLAAKSGEPLWSDTAARWQGYLTAGGPTAC
jgi:hypothetical protein